MITNELIKQYCNELALVLMQKNQDYGNSFFEQFEEYGPTSAIIRLDDKLRRLKTLRTHTPQVAEERLSDTFLDVSGYGLLAYISLELQKQQKPVDTDEPSTKKYHTTEDWMKLEDVKQRITPKKIYRCDNCSTVLGEIACTNEFGGSYCSGQCSEIGKSRHIHTLSLEPKKPPYADLDDE